IHQMDIARWFLGESSLSPRVISIGGRLGYEDAGDTPNTQVVYHDFEKAPLIFETRGLPRSKAAQKEWRNSMDNYRGSRIGVIVQCRDGYVVIPSYTRATAFDNDKQQVAHWEGGGDHYHNFLKAVESRKTSDLNADILEGHLSSALCHTGAISHRIGHKEAAREIAEQIRSNSKLSDSFERMAKHLDANEVDIERSTITLGPWLEMDPKAERFTNSDAANELLTRDYRKPFVVPDMS
ncbi:MAG: gfo/Idh/MocA family oxidoreductase, partial [Pirellulaceae bacterium]